MGYSYMKRACLVASHDAIGLQTFQKQDVLTWPECINRVLRSKSRQKPSTL